MTSQSPTTSYRDLPEHLADLKRGSHGRAPLAELHRSLRTFPAYNPGALRIVVPLVAPYRNAQDAGVLLAGLWAAYHQAFTAPVGGQGTLGAALRRVDPDVRDRLLSRLTARAAGDPRALRRASAGAIKALAAANAAPSWAQLHEDLARILRGYPVPVHRRWLTDALTRQATDPAPAPEEE